MWFCVALLGSGCGSDAEPAAGSAQGADAGADALGPDAQLRCGSAGHELPAGLTEIGHDSGELRSNVRAESLAITYNNTEYELAEVALSEAVRFELQHPARVHGFAVIWQNLSPSAEPSLELGAGLYRDFGHNGFDYWEQDPLYTGTRCASDVRPGEWLNYVFDQPIELAEPGLVYVAHRADRAEQAVFAFDDNAANVMSCDEFDACHSAFNLPEVKDFYNGLSFPFANNFMVRLYVEYTEQAKPEDKVFKLDPASPEAQHASFGDYDNDGWDDALLGGKLYHNQQGELLDVTAASGIAGLGIDYTGGVFGDYDNDGCLDLFLFVESPAQADALLHSNCDGSFSDVTGAAQINDAQSYEDCNDPLDNTHSPTAAAAWLDLDADGLLDLYLANFICWEKEKFYSDTVYRNNGDGTFSDWTAGHGFPSKRLASRGVSPADADGDGDIDLFVNNYRLQQNQYFQNQGAGQFQALENELGLGGVATMVGLSRYYGHTIGAAWGDLDNDGDLDLVAANLAHPRFFNFSNKTQILLNGGAAGFSDRAGAWEKPWSDSGLRYQETHSVPLLADFDQDANLDLVITAVYDGRPTDFYWGKGDGSFELDAYHAGISTENGWGVAGSDLDNDGDVDLFATRRFDNQLPAAKRGHFLQVRLVGDAGSNRSGIGAVVRIAVGSKTLTRQVQGGSGKGGQDSQSLHFGLGSETSVGEVQVRFPGKPVQIFQGPFNADQRLWLHESGAVKSGFGP